MSAVFAGLEFVLAGLDFTTSERVQALVKANGGSVAYFVRSTTNFLITTENETRIASTAVKNCALHSIPMVTASFVSDSVASGGLVEPSAYAVSRASTSASLPSSSSSSSSTLLKTQGGGGSSSSLSGRASSSTTTTTTTTVTNKGSLSAGSSNRPSATTTTTTATATTSLSSSSSAAGAAAAAAAAGAGRGKWRDARVFISSTFRDMHGERDYLTRVVFPELQDRCNRLRVHVTPVDLRWGVTEDDTDSALEICLTEVDNCRPLFLGLVGERYGWVPSRYKLPDEPRFDWVKSMPPGLSVTALEMHHGALRSPTSAAGFFFRHPDVLRHVPLDSLADFEAESPAHAAGVAALKDQIRGTLPFAVHEYRASWHGVVEGKPMTGSLESFGEAALEWLWKVIQEEFPTVQKKKNDLEVARSYHENFIESHSHMFVGRTQLVNTICTEMLDFGTSHMLVIAGEPGSGKTSLVSAVADRFMKKKVDGGEDITTIAHFVGAAPGSTNIKHVLTRLIREVNDQCGTKAKVPDDYSGIKDAFLSCLLKVHKRLILIIDAINQLEDAYSALSLDWLPSYSNDNVKIVLTCLPGKWLTATEAFGWPRIPVGPLSTPDRTEIVTSTLWQYRKRLSPAQMALLLEKADAHKPLYLIIACEELRVFGVFEDLTRRIEGMAGDIPAIFAEVLARLEADHGYELVSGVMSLLQVSRNGLSEAEILALLAPLAPSNAPAQMVNGEQRLPTSVWVRLYRSLKAYLRPPGENASEESSILDFFHRQLAKAVQRRYLETTSEAGERNLYATHAQLARYYIRKGDPHGDGTWAGGSRRAVSEAPFHALKGHLWHEVEALLTDIVFIEAKCRVGLSSELVSDYLAVLEDVSKRGFEDETTAQRVYRPPWLPSPLIPKRAFDSIVVFHRFLASRVHHLHRRPALTFTCAMAEPDSSLVHIVAARRRNTGAETRPYVKWNNKPHFAKALIMTQDCHTMVVHKAVPSPTGESLVVSVADDRLGRVWNTETGAIVGTLKGHTDSIYAADWSPNGEFIVTGAFDETVQFWRTEIFSEAFRVLAPGRVYDVAWCPSGALVAVAVGGGQLLLINTAAGHSTAILEQQGMPKDKAVMSVAWGPPSKGGKTTLLAVGGGDGSVRVLEVAANGTTAKLLWLSSTHRKIINKVVYSKNGEVVVAACEDRIATVFAASNGTTLCRLAGHKDGVTGVAVNSSATQVVSVSHDNLIMVWNIPSGERVGMLAGHTGTVFDVRYLRDESHIVTCSFDRSSKIWDLREELRLLDGHAARLLGLSFCGDGSMVASASRDKNVKVWDVATGRELKELNGHASNVFAVAFAPDGQTLVSASRDHTVAVWNVKTSQVIRSHQLTAIAYDVCFYHDGLDFAVACEDKNVYIYNLESGALVRVLYGHRLPVMCVRLSDDDDKIATGGGDAVVKLWKGRGGRKLATLVGHTAPVVSVTFDRSGTRVASGADDKTVRVWSALNAQLLAVLRSHAEAVTAMSWSLDGRHVLSGSTDGTIIMWDAEDGYKEDLVFPALGRVCALATSPSKADMGMFALGDGSGAIYLCSPIIGESTL